MFADWEVRPQIERFLESVGLSHLGPLVRKRKLGEPFVYLPVYYRRKKKEITYCLDQLKSYHFYYPYLTKQEFINLCLLQQIGIHLYWEDQEDYLSKCLEEVKKHPKDSNSIRHEVMSKAFAYALPYVPAHLLEPYGMLNEIHLAKFDDALDAERIKLEYLSAHYRSIVPKNTILPTRTSLNKHLRWSKAAWAEEKKADILQKVLTRIFDEDEFVVQYYKNNLMIILLKDKHDIRIIQHSHYNLDEPATSYLVDTSNFVAKKNKYFKSLQEA
ncbi:hypothetical protein CN918_30225 [Priestia megaterium]|nr:hypothetical protein CN918_30225 [Priestia megaterium]